MTARAPTSPGPGARVRPWRDGPSPRRRGRPGRASGFTLIEIMVVLVILGVMLLWLPARIDGFGDRSKLDSAASTMVSVLTAARELAIIDGHEVRLQYLLSEDEKDRNETGRFRYLVTSRVKDTPEQLAEDGERPVQEAPSDDEWIATAWRDFPAGIQLQAYSQESGIWIKGNRSGDPIEISFAPDGGVRPPHGIRLVSVDLPQSVERTITITVNALTSAAQVFEGEGNLPKRLDPSDFR